MTTPSKSRWSAAVKVIVTVFFLAVALYLVDLDVLGDRLRHAAFGPLAVAGLIFALSGFAGAASWLCVLRTRLPEMSYREAAACHWSGMFFNSFLPTNVGGDVVKGYLLAHAHGQVGFVVTSLLLDRTVNLLILVEIGLFAFLIHLGKTAWALGLLVLIALLFLACSACARRLAEWTHRWPREGLCGRAASLLEPVFELLSQRRAFAKMLAAAGLSQTLKTWQNVFLIQALALDIPAACVWYVIPLFGIVSALPISIGGLGVREVLAHHLATPLGTDNTHLVAFSLASQFIVTAVDMFGILPFVFARRKAAREKL